MQAAVQDALAGRGRTVLLSGEPGIGKTRLASELATVAQHQQAHVLLAAVTKGTGPRRSGPGCKSSAAMSPGVRPTRCAPKWARGRRTSLRSCPRCGSNSRSFPPRPGWIPEQARFRFFDSLSTFLTTAAHRQPLVLILDDLHWADTPSLLLLQFVAREIAATPLLVIGTYRDLVLGRDHPLLQTIGEVVRTPGSQRVHLQGLSEADVAQFLADTGLQPSEALVAAVYRETEGNPFFLTEVVHLLEATAARPGAQGALLALSDPQSVQAAIGRRLHPLSADCQHLLQLAAVLGGSLASRPWQRWGSRSGARTGGAGVSPAGRSRGGAGIVEAPGAIGRYSFAHALIRETLYEELSALRRVRLHQQIATVLEHRYPSPAGASDCPPAPRWRNSPIIFSKPHRVDRRLTKPSPMPARRARTR